MFETLSQRLGAAFSALRGRGELNEQNVEEGLQAVRAALLEADVHFQVARDLVERVRRHPLMRALRPDKMALAALTATLGLWRDRPEAVPVWRMATVSLEELTRRAQKLVEALEDNDDVQTVTANFEVSDAVMAKLSAA